MIRQFFAMLSALLLVASGNLAAFDKESYYSSADGKKGSALKTALCGIINSHTTVSYDGLWTAFETTDVRADGKVWDMYSSATNYTFGKDQAGSYSGEGDVYNREHSFPKSWFDDGKPMYSDLYHLYPTDGYVNGRRSNYCFGEVASATYSSKGSFSKLGSPTSELTGNGCSEKLVFEPNDLYKGDLARSYFYMVTAYENQLTSWSGCGMLSRNKFPAFSNWAKLLLLKWSKGDPVSEKETNRIEAVYGFQKNRNPFIDFPGLEQYIWGTWADSTFSVSDYRNPYTYTPAGGGGEITPTDPSVDPVDPSIDPVDPPVGPVDPAEPEDTTEVVDPSGPTVPVADGDYVLVTSNRSDWSGQYLFVYKSEGGECYVLNGALTTLDKDKNYITVEEEDGIIASSDAVNAASFIVTATSVTDYYSVCASSSQLYMGASASKNSLETTANYAKEYGNKFAIKNGDAVITATGGYVLRFNTVAPRFRYYGGSQQPIKLYRRQTTLDGITTAQSSIRNGSVYDLQGRLVDADAVLRPGIYIRDGRKFLVK